MNITEFIKKFIYNGAIEEAQCPVTNNKCSLFLSPTTVLAKNNDLLIIGDNRTDQSGNKVILITNINLEENSFDISYMESISTEKFYLYLFTNVLTNTSYSYGLSISLSSTGSAATILTNSLFNVYNILNDYSHPPIITLDNGKLALKLTNTKTNKLEYIHHVIDFDMVIQKPKFQKKDILDKNKELYRQYFSNQIKAYKEYYLEQLRIAEERKLLEKKEKEQKISSFKIDKKYIIAGILFILCICIIILIYFIYSRNKNTQIEIETETKPIIRKKKKIIKKTPSKTVNE
jgi:hypothetical protein